MQGVALAEQTLPQGLAVRPARGLHDALDVHLPHHGQRDVRVWLEKHASLLYMCQMVAKGEMLQGYRMSRVEESGM